MFGETLGRRVKERTYCKLGQLVTKIIENSFVSIIGEKFIIRMNNPRSTHNKTILDKIIKIIFEALIVLTAIKNDVS